MVSTASRARRLAKHLGTSVMAPYRHFADQQALLSSLLDHVIDPDALLSPADNCDGDEADVLVSSMTRIYDVFLAHPALVALAGTPASLGPNCLCFLEELLGRLQVGVSPMTAARSVHRVLTYTFGCAIVAAAAEKSDAITLVVARFGDMDPASFPHALASAPELLCFPTRDAFVEGLRCIAADSLRL